jgi:FkbM family methyltransferase
MEQVIRLSLSNLRRYLIRRAYMRSLYSILPKRRFAKMNLLGECVEIDRQDLEQVYLESDCIREPENIFIYRALAKSGVCRAYVDVGANYGHVASKVYENFEKVILVDANPNAALFLRTVFGKKAHVKVINCALVENQDVTKVTLMVSETSSGLAHISESSGAMSRSDEQAFECTATTLARLIEDEEVQSAYVKIDVEGFESSVIRGGGKILQNKNFIVGFEALSKNVAMECSALFTDHTFYFGRFDFLDPSGALTRSAIGIVKSLFGDSGIVIYKTKSIADVPLSNFSQIVAVHNSRVTEFENSLSVEHDALKRRIELT